MQKEKSVTIPVVLFNQMAAYILTDPEPHNIDLHKKCERGIEEKIDRIIKHNLYTDYKTAPSEEEREKARQAYLNAAGIPNSFRYSADFISNNA